MKKTMLMLGMAAVVAAGPALAASDLWLHIKVHEAESGERVTVNLPMSMVEKAAPLIPTEAKASGRIQFGDDEMTAQELRDLWRSVQESPDGVYVTSEGPHESVRVAKRGAYLEIDARKHRDGDRREDARIKVPVRVVEALLSAGGDELDVTAAIQALARHGAGELVTVTSERETVRIWVDGSAEAK